MPATEKEQFDEAELREFLGNKQFSKSRFQDLKDESGFVSKRILLAEWQRREEEGTTKGNLAADADATSDVSTVASAVQGRGDLDEELRVVCGKKGKKFVKPAAVSLLLANGADPTAPDTDGWNALLYAAGEGQTESIQNLVASGDDLHLLNYASEDDGCTALWVACCKNNCSTIRSALPVASLPSYFSYHLFVRSLIRPYFFLCLFLLTR